MEEVEDLTVEGEVEEDLEVEEEDLQVDEGGLEVEEEEAEVVLTDSKIMDLRNMLLVSTKSNIGMEDE